LKNKRNIKPESPSENSGTVKSDDVVFDAKIIENKQEKPVKISFSESIFHGPLPPPEILQQYNDCYPKAAEIIFSNFQKQVTHRINIEDRVVNSNIRNGTLGIIAGFILGLVGIVGGIYLLTIDKEISGYVALIASITSLTLVYIKGKKNTSEEIKQKRNKKK